MCDQDDAFDYTQCPAPSHMVAGSVVACAIVASLAVLRVLSRASALLIFASLPLPKGCFSLVYCAPLVVLMRVAIPTVILTLSLAALLPRVLLGLTFLALFLLSVISRMRCLAPSLHRACRLCGTLSLRLLTVCNLKRAHLNVRVKVHAFPCWCCRRSCSSRLCCASGRHPLLRRG